LRLCGHSLPPLEQWCSCMSADTREDQAQSKSWVSCCQDDSSYGTPTDQVCLGAKTSLRSPPNDLAFLLRAHNAGPDREVQAEWSGPHKSLRDKSKRLLGGTLDEPEDREYLFENCLMSVPEVGEL
jgi:hypothetical protein